LPCPQSVLADFIYEFEVEYGCKTFYHICGRIQTEGVCLSVELRGIGAYESNRYTRLVIITQYEPLDSYSSPNTNRLTPRNVRWRGHVEEKINARKFLMGKPRRKKRYWRRWE
jgi:hypothetical protein